MKRAHAEISSPTAREPTNARVPTTTEHLRWRYVEDWDALDKVQKTQVATCIQKYLCKVKLRRLIEESEDEESHDEAQGRPDASGNQDEDDDEAKDPTHSRCKTTPIVFQGIRSFTCGDQTHDIATFQFDDRTMLLIPGGRSLQLGYDGSTDPFPSQAEREEYEEEYVKKYGFDPIEDHLSNVLSCAHCVNEIQPYLIDQESERMSEEPDTVRELVKRTGCWALPTESEWEWAYRGGTKCAFPMGNAFTGFVEPNNPSPCPDHYTNAFGFVPPQSTYDVEMVHDEMITRGGDGGVCECGG
eukprot:CAMPEP_0198127400 /NCGR_PEP_ID=MMETSP1442-20131203/47043_1 /TAXON_ID= /ORGANISM="Craspedostauros australis, Strain CCMP3328" /LENGTH=299 /DNA_ID=CAMNT_0043787367 /DNA_START=33 /DNA_END=929 /DNA_ORIENTATION=+